MTATLTRPDEAVATPNAAGPHGLAPAEVELLGRELEAIRQDVLDCRGASDAAYIRRVIKVQRSLELAGRLLLLRSRNRKAWLLGTAALATAKILDNMEIGHKGLLHGLVTSDLRRCVSALEGCAPCPSHSPRSFART